MAKKDNWDSESNTNVQIYWTRSKEGQDLKNQFFKVAQSMRDTNPKDWSKITVCARDIFKVGLYSLMRVPPEQFEVYIESLTESVRTGGANQDQISDIYRKTTEPVIIEVIQAISPNEISDLEASKIHQEVKNRVAIKKKVNEFREEINEIINSHYGQEKADDESPSILQQAIQVPGDNTYKDQYDKEVARALLIIDEFIEEE